jgi:hypothetical protein
MTKKERMVFGSIALLLAVMFVLAGCNNPAASEETETQFSGTWYSNDGMDFTVTFTAKDWEVPNMSKGTYTANNNTATLKVTHISNGNGGWTPETATINAIINSNTLTISGSVSGSPILFTFSRTRPTPGNTDTAKFIGTWYSSDNQGYTLKITTSDWEVTNYAKGTYTASNTGLAIKFTQRTDGKGGWTSYTTGTGTVTLDAATGILTVTAILPGDDGGIYTIFFSKTKTEPDPDNPFSGTWYSSDYYNSYTLTVTPTGWEVLNQAKGTYTRTGGSASTDAVLTVTHVWDNYYGNGNWTASTGYGTASIKSDTLTVFLYITNQSNFEFEFTRDGKKRYTVTFSAGLGSGTPPASQTVESGAYITLPGKGNMTAPTGQIFEGWRESSYSYGTLYKEGETYYSGIYNNITFTAQWTDPYTVTYNAGEGSGDPPATMTVEDGQTITLPGQEYMTAPAGKIFTGWRKDDYSSYSLYKEGDTYTISSKYTTFYAQWVTAYTVTYNAGEGTGTSRSQTVESGTSITLPGQGSFTAPAGKIFNGWERYGTTYTMGERYNVNSDTTFTARWTTAYRITFTVGEGSGTPPGTQTITGSGQSITLPGQGSMIAPTIDGVTAVFNGWSWNGQNFKADATVYSINGDRTFTARWNDKVYIGIVAFDAEARISAISNDFNTAKTFITAQTNNVDSTALCYAVSKAVTLFDESGLPDFDYTYVVTFTDGADNSSSTLYYNDGLTGITQNQVYTQAHNDLVANSELISYAIGFGSELSGADMISKMQNLVVGGGEYQFVNYSNQLSTLFNNIAESVMVWSKNIVLQTNSGVYTNDEPKYIKLIVQARNASGTPQSDTITGKLVYSPGATPEFTITDMGNSYITFDDSGLNSVITATVENNKIQIPLSNLKFEYNSTAYFIQSTTVEVSTDGVNYREESEDSFTMDDTSQKKKIGVVLVMDCSRSLGSSFSTVKEAANNFIDTLLSK